MSKDYLPFTDDPALADAYRCYLYDQENRHV